MSWWSREWRVGFVPLLLMVPACVAAELMLLTALPVIILQDAAVLLASSGAVWLWVVRRTRTQHDRAVIYERVIDSRFALFTPRVWPVSVQRMQMYSSITVFWVMLARLALVFWPITLAVLAVWFLFRQFQKRLLR